MNKLLISAVFISAFLLAAFHAGAAGDDQTLKNRIGFSFEAADYEWKEFDDDGSRLLDETGYLYGLAFDVDSGREILGWRAGGSLFGGEVDYTGVTWSKLPVKTDVVYLGTKFYTDIVPNCRLESGLRLKTFLGLGFRGWLRDLEDTQTQDGTPVKGAEEWWYSIYGRAGAGVSYPLYGEVEIFTEAGCKLPIYTVNHANLFVFGSPSVDLEPEMKFSPFYDAGIRWKNMSFNISYETLRFKKSESVWSGIYKLRQPESEAQIYNFRAAWLIAF